MFRAGVVRKRAALRRGSRGRSVSSPAAPRCWPMPPGPIFTIYCLAVALPKFELVGTSAWFFFIINAFKVPFSVALGLIHGQHAGVECDPEPRDPRGHVHRPLADRSHSAATLRRVASRLRLRRGAAAGGTVVMRGRASSPACCTCGLCLFACPLSLSPCTPSPLNSPGLGILKAALRLSRPIRPIRTS